MNNISSAPFILDSTFLYSVLCAHFIVDSPFGTVFFLTQILHTSIFGVSNEMFGKPNQI